MEAAASVLTYAEILLVSTVATGIGRMGEMATSCLVTVLGASRGAILQAHLHFEGMEVRH